MNGIHDLGGMHGFGPIEREEDEPLFHADWEKTVNAINQAMRAQGFYNLDEFRHGIERMAPARYLAASYYERWLATVVTNLVDKGVVTTDELDARTTLIQTHPDTAIPRREDPALLARLHQRRQQATTRRPGRAAPRFAVGDQVVARNLHPSGHTRLPRYVRGKRGVIDRVHGVHVFPDTNAHGRGEQPQAVYSVRFSGRELWGEAAEPGQSLYIDLFESYLEPA